MGERNGESVFPTTKVRFDETFFHWCQFIRNVNRKSQFGSAFTGNEGHDSLAAKALGNEVGERKVSNVHQFALAFSRASMGKP